MCWSRILRSVAAMQASGFTAVRRQVPMRDAMRGRGEPFRAMPSSEHGARPVVRHRQKPVTSSAAPAVQSRRGDVVFAGNLGNRRPVAVCLQHDRRLHMLRPAPTACRTRNDLDTPTIRFVVTVKTSASPYVAIHERPPAYAGVISDEQTCQTTRVMSGRLLLDMRPGRSLPPAGSCCGKRPRKAAKRWLHRKTRPSGMSAVSAVAVRFPIRGWPRLLHTIRATEPAGCEVVEPVTECHRERWPARRLMRRICRPSAPPW